MIEIIISARRPRPPATPRRPPLKSQTTTSPATASMKLVRTEADQSDRAGGQPRADCDRELGDVPDAGRRERAGARGPASRSRSGSRSGGPLGLGVEWMTGSSTAIRVSMPRRAPRSWSVGRTLAARARWRCGGLVWQQDLGRSPRTVAGVRAVAGRLPAVTASERGIDVVGAGRAEIAGLCPRSA